jgi:hypothetical protein
VTQKKTRVSTALRKKIKCAINIDARASVGEQEAGTRSLITHHPFIAKSAMDALPKLS